MKIAIISAVQWALRAPLVTLAALVILLSGCTGGDKAGTPSPQSPTAPTTPTSPPNPDPPAPPSAPQPCTFALTAEPDDFGPEGGTTLLRITTAAGCTWSIRTDATWLAVEGATSGEGPSAVKLSAQRNDTTVARRITVSVGDASLVLAQDGRSAPTACAYQVSPVGIVLPRDRWTGEVAISTTPGCTWTAASTEPWLRLRSGSGSGRGTVTYDADFNPQTRYSDRRSGVIEIRWSAPTAGQNVHVTQWGDCTITASPATGGLPSGASYSGASAAGTLSVSPSGGEVHFWVLSEPFMGCAWTAESADSWINWRSPRLHQISQGDGDLAFTVPAKATAETRRAVITLGGRFVLTIVQ